jgi:DNA polymerase III subunit epsilon
MAMTWYKGPLATFDLETTGVEPESARIVSAAFIWLDENDSVLPDSFYRLANPEVEIPVEASAVHGITKDRVLKEALSRLEIVNRIAVSFDLATQRNVPVVIFNARFDLTLFLAERLRTSSLSARIGPIVDPLVIDRALDKYRRGSRKLEDVAKFYNVKLGSAHDAAADAVASARIVRKMATRYPGQLDDLNMLQAAQARWHEEWKRGLNAWWDSKGIDKRIPDEEVWPTHLPFSDI